ncbi:MAG: hypothetical protein ACE5KH_00630 [Candidatus Geothermarchaeales archaeon]
MGRLALSLEDLKRRRRKRIREEMQRLRDAAMREMREAETQDEAHEAELKLSKAKGLRLELEREE